MHRTSTAQSPVRTTQAQRMTEKIPLDPVLQQALASLDTQLENELLRYRRQRTLGRGSYTPQLGQRLVKATLPAMDEGADPPATPPTFHPTAAVPPLVAIANPANPGSVEPAALELKELAKQYASEVAAVSDQTVAGSPEDYLESSEELLRTLSQEQAEVAAEQSFLQSLLTPLGLGSMLLLLMTSALFGFVIMNPSSVSQLLRRSEPITANGTSPTAIDGNPGSASTNPQPNLATQEFPELALGNLGSIPSEGAGVSGVPAPAIAQPGTKAAHLGASGLASGTPTAVPTVPTTPSVTAPEANSAAAVPSPRQLAPAPSADPAPERAYVPPARSYSPPPARSYSPPPARSYSPPRTRTYNPPARRANPPVQPYTPPRAVLPAPKPIPVPVPEVDRTPPPPSPTPTASVAPTGSGYKVVTPYTSDKTLEEYRGKVPDAYVKNYSDGAKVQFGAYGDENSAKSQAEELRKQGIPAEVYKP